VPRFAEDEINGATVEQRLAASPDLAQATDPKGRTALHLACGVKSSSRDMGDPNGLRTVTALLGAGAGLEVGAPMDEDEGDFRATHCGMPWRGARICRWYSFC
jgi:hypothetical protein